MVRIEGFGCGSSDRGKKDVDGKLRIDLIPPESVFELARVYTEGAKKYGDRNWEKGIPANECIAALERHFLRFKLGQDMSPETGIHEMAHAAFWCMAIVSQYYRGVEVGDVEARIIEPNEAIEHFMES